MRGPFVDEDLEQLSATDHGRSRRDGSPGPAPARSARSRSAASQNRGREATSEHLAVLDLLRLRSPLDQSASTL